MKKFFILITIVSMSITNFSFTQTNIFAWTEGKDTTSFINQIDNAAFQSDNEVTREDFCIIIAKVFGINQYSSVMLPFIDIEEIREESIPYIASLYEAGLLYGCKEYDGIYMRPNMNITLHDAVVLLGRTLDRASQNGSIQGEYTVANHDAGYWDWFLENRFLENTFDRELDSQKTILFGETSDLILKVLNYMKQNEVVVSTYSGTGSRGAFNGGLMESQFTLPYDLLFDATGSLIVLDTYNNLIRTAESGGMKILTGSVSALDDYGFPRGRYKDGDLDQALLNRPSSAVYNKNGELLLADSANHVIRSIRDDKIFTFSGSVAGFQDGTVRTAKFNNPMSIAIDENDNIYVADTLNHCIRKIDTDGNVTTIAGVPEEYGFEDGMAETALFREPSGIAVSNDGATIFISDTGNHKIRKIENGMVTTIAGLITETDEDDSPYGGFQDGVAEQSRFNLPRGLTLADENLIIADSGNNRIRVINRSGVVMTLCGNGEPGDRDGAALDSLLNQPMGVHFHNGLIYIADTSNNKIKVIPFHSDIYE